MTEFWLPFPPTANSMFGLKGYRRFPSKAYQAWRDDADTALNQQELVVFGGAVSVEITLQAPTKRKWDLDNRVKPILDLLVSRGIISDDNSEVIKRIVVEVGDQVGATVKLVQA